MWFKQNEQKPNQQPEATPQQQPQQHHGPQHAQAPPAAPVAAPELPRPVTHATPVATAPSANASRITSGITIKGEISGREDLWIAGNVEGTLRFDTARIVVGAGGKSHGKLEAREIVIEGRSDGDLSATERLEITSTGVVKGDATAPRVSLQEGSIFNGSVEVLRAGESRSHERATQPSRGSQSQPQSQSQPKDSRPPRQQNVQASGAAAGAGATPPATSAPSGSTSGSLTESGNGEGAGATILMRGIAVDPSEKAE